VNLAARRCTISSWWMHLFVEGSQTVVPYSTSGRTRALYALAFRSGELMRRLRRRKARVLLVELRYRRSDPNDLADFVTFLRSFPISDLGLQIGYRTYLFIFLLLLLLLFFFSILFSLGRPPAGLTLTLYSYSLTHRTYAQAMRLDCMHCLLRSS